MRMTYAKKGLPSFYDRACLSLPINHKYTSLNFPPVHPTKLSQGQWSASSTTSSNRRIQRPTLHRQIQGTPQPYIKSPADRDLGT